VRPGFPVLVLPLLVLPLLVLILIFAIFALAIVTAAQDLAEADIKDSHLQNATCLHRGQRRRWPLGPTSKSYVLWILRVTLLNSKI
jgi:hypothetical protein